MYSIPFVCQRNSPFASVILRLSCFMKGVVKVCNGTNLWQFFWKSGSIWVGNRCVRWVSGCNGIQHSKGLGGHYLFYEFIFAWSIWYKSILVSIWHWKNYVLFWRHWEEVLSVFGAHQVLIDDKCLPGAYIISLF